MIMSRGKLMKKMDASFSLTDIRAVANDSKYSGSSAPSQFNLSCSLPSISLEGVISNSEVQNNVSQIIERQAYVCDFFEISSATNQFSLKPFSSLSSSTSWRCMIRKQYVILVQRKFFRPINIGEVDYIHHSSGLGCLIHNHIKSYSIIVTPKVSAKICHFGTAQLCREMTINDCSESQNLTNYEISGSGSMKLHGTRCYMDPECQETGMSTQKTDVCAFGVVILELFSGNQLMMHRSEDDSGRHTMVPMIDTVREAVKESGGVGLRKWVDKRLKDSFPVAVAERLIHLGLDCVSDDPDTRDLI